MNLFTIPQKLESEQLLHDIIKQAGVRPKSDEDIIAGMKRNNQTVITNNQLEFILSKLSTKKGQEFYHLLGEEICQNIGKDLNEVVRKLIEEKYNELSEGNNG